MSTCMLISMLGSLGLAASASPGIPAGIPSTAATQQWGAAVMETLQTDLRIEPIRLNDLADTPTVASGSASATAAALGPARLGASYALPAPPINAVVSRDLNRVWRLSVPSANRSRARVTSHVESLRGEAGRLSLVGREEVSIPVVVLERPATTRLDEAGNRIVEGGIALQIPTASLQHAGQYAGRLVLRTEGF